MKDAASGFQEYYRYGFSLLINLGHYYKVANMENRQKMPGLIFPEKLVFDNNTFQTMKPSEVLNLLCNGVRVSAWIKKRAAVKLLSPVL